VSTSEPMQSVRRRAIPGMVGQADDAAKPPLPRAQESTPIPLDHAGPCASSAVRRSRDYSATRLTNVRLPVDLHDRFRALVHEVGERHPRLRKASLTELIVALLEEGPQTADEVAEMIRRKRLAEHGEGLK
jgi:hypothetical protein